MKKSSRIRLTKPSIATRADAEKILGEIAADTAFVDQTLAILNQRITEIRQEYEGQIDAAKRTIEQKGELLQHWAEENVAEFAGKKSIEFIHGRIGFRTGTPKLKTIAGWTWDRVLSVIAPVYIRIKKEVDKEGLLSSHAQGIIGEKDLREIGVKLVQEESFFVEPKLEEQTTARAVSAA